MSPSPMTGRDDLAFPIRLRMALERANECGLAAASILGLTSSGPETPLGYPILWLEVRPGHTVSVGPMGSGSYEAFD